MVATSPSKPPNPALKIPALGEGRQPAFKLHIPRPEARYARLLLALTELTLQLGSLCLVVLLIEEYYKLGLCTVDASSATARLRVPYSGSILPRPQTPKQQSSCRSISCKLCTRATALLASARARSWTTGKSINHDGNDVSQPSPVAFG